VTDSPLIASIFGISKKLDLCQQTIYQPGDWFFVNAKKEPMKYTATFFLFYYPDYLAVSLNDLVIDVSPVIIKLRTKFWKKDVVKHGVMRFPIPMQINGKVNEGHRSNICFLGQVRGGTGLNILLSILPNLNEKYGIRFKVFGPNNSKRDNFQRNVKEQNLEHLIDFHGWINMETDYHLIGDCFCGINFIESREKNHSIFVTPGKVMQYMQNLIPPLVTEYSAASHFIKLLKKHNWGIATELTSKRIKSDIEHLFTNQKFFRDNLKKYAMDYPYIPISENLKIIKKPQSKDS
jgi:glycosyltransferase involved in cell wall biosynthesis